MTDAFASEFGYQATITDAEGNSVPNPQTKAQFAKQQVAAYVKQITRNWEANQAAGAARQAKEAEINALAIT